MSKTTNLRWKIKFKDLQVKSSISELKKWMQMNINENKINANFVKIFFDATKELLSAHVFDKDPEKFEVLNNAMVSYESNTCSVKQLDHAGVEQAGVANLSGHTGDS